MKGISKILVLFLLITMLTVCTVYSHGGRTDSSGGHRDNKNKSGLGYYHYHHGMSAHLHNNGKCPYKTKTYKKSSYTYKSSNKTNTTSKSTVAKNQYIKLFINNNEIKLYTKPLILDNTVMVPIREVFEPLGALIKWNEDNNTIIVDYKDIYVELKINSDYIIYNDLPMKIKAPVKQVNNVTMIPVTLACNIFNTQVDWESSNKTIKITNLNTNKILDFNKLDITIHHLDLEGCSVFIDIGNYDILINCGTAKDSEKIVTYLSNYNTNNIDLLVITDITKDHMEGLQHVVNNFKVNKIISPALNQTSNSINEPLSQSISRLTNNLTISQGKDFEESIKSNIKFKTQCLNNTLTCTLICEKISYLFTENYTLNGGKECYDIIGGFNINSDIKKLLIKNNPKYNINIGQSLLYPLNNYNYTLLGTKEYGNIVIHTNGYEVSMSSNSIQEISNYKGKIKLHKITNSNIGELVYIKNISNESITLKNWTLTAKNSDNTYMFPNIQIKPDNTIYIYSNNNNTQWPAPFYHWSKKKVWDDTFDIGYLYDSEDKYVDSYMINKKVNN